MNFVSPIRNPEVRIDSMGDGHFLAPRGDRLHEGLDIVVLPGDKVYSPINGKFVRIAYPYMRDTSWKGIYIQGEHYWIKIFYIYPFEALRGKTLQAGDCIGTAQNISEKHGSDMLSHIHLELAIPPMRSISHDGLLIGNEINIDPEPLVMNSA